MSLAISLANLAILLFGVAPDEASLDLVLSLEYKSSKSLTFISLFFFAYFLRNLSISGGISALENSPKFFF